MTSRQVFSADQVFTGRRLVPNAAVLVDQDQAGAMQAFMSGKIKIQGDMTKLMAMQGAPPDEFAKKVAEEIKAITS